MAKIVSSWLNDELQLSRHVTDFEKDFSNGYLFGEILFKLGLQTDFKDFKDQDNPKAMLANFSRLVRLVCVVFAVVSREEEICYLIEIFLHLRSHRTPPCGSWARP
jgi:hypothetical protein